jgi:hypothetical protein
MSIPREAVEAALDKFMGAVPWRESRHDAEMSKNMGSALAAALPHLRAAKDAEIAALREALRRHMVVVDDWLHIYAPDECDESRVKEAKARVYDRGTLAYIAYAQQDARAALEMSGGVL